MAKSEFTEMQYVLGFVSEFTNHLRSLTGQTPWFILPSPQVEKDIGVDIVIEHFDHMEFHQYKRSDFLNTYSAKEYTQGLPKSIKPYYRFSLYEKASQQFTRLRLLAEMFPEHRVYYVAPKFSTHKEYQDYFWKKLIMKNSIFVNCMGFNSPRIRKYLNHNPGEHAMVFDSKSDARYLFSDGLEINENDDLRGYEQIRLQGGEKSFVMTVNKIFNSLLEDNLESFLTENNEIPEDISTRFNMVRTKLLIDYNINMIPIINN